jgi:hypothetical protein
MTVSQGATTLTFTADGDCILRSAEGVRLQSAVNDFLQLKDGLAQMKGQSVVLEEQESDSLPAKLTLGSAGAKLEKDNEELFQLLLEVFEKLGGAKVPGVGPVADSAALLFTALFEAPGGYLERLKKLGDV